MVKGSDIIIVNIDLHADLGKSFNTVIFSTAMPNGANSGFNEPFSTPHWQNFPSSLMWFDKNHTAGELGPNGKGHYVLIVRGLDTVNERITAILGGAEWDLTEDITPPPPKPPPKPPPQPPPAPGFPAAPNSINLIDWLKWLGLVIQWFANQIWVTFGNALTYHATLLWSLLPDWIKILLRNLSAFLQFLRTVQDNPSKALADTMLGLATEHSPSAITEMVKHFPAVLIDALGTQLIESREQYIDSLQNLFLPEIIKIRTETLDEIVANPTDASTITTNALTKLAHTIATVSLYGIMADAIPFVDTQTVNDLIALIPGMSGLQGVKDASFNAQIENSVIVTAGRQARAKFKLGQLGFSEAVAARQQKHIDKLEYERIASEERALPAEKAETAYRATLAPPGPTDFLTWNRRHPDRPITLDQFGEIVGLDATAPEGFPATYKEILGERAYSDPSLLQARTMYELDQIDDATVKDIVRRQGFRDDKLPGQTKSDGEIATQFVTEFAVKSWNKQEANAVRQEFIVGNITQENMTQALGDLITNAKARQAAIDSAVARRKIYERARPKGSKPFTIAELIAFRVAGSIDDAFIQSDVASYGYDEPHTTAVQDYITKQVGKKTGI